MERERERGPGALNVVHAAGPAEWDGGWSDVIVHTRSWFLSSCRAASFMFASPPGDSFDRCHIKTSTRTILRHLYFNVLVCGVVVEVVELHKIAAQTSDVKTGPRQPLPVLEIVFFPQPFDQI